MRFAIAGSGTPSAAAISTCESLTKRMMRIAWSVGSSLAAAMAVICGEIAAAEAIETPGVLGNVFGLPGFAQSPVIRRKIRVLGRLPVIGKAVYLQVFPAGQTPVRALFGSVR